MFFNKISFSFAAEHQPQNIGSVTRINQEQNQSNNNNSPYVISRRAAATQSSSTSASVIVNSDAVPSSSTTQLRGHVFQSHVQVDHNYGEPGPSTLRNTRRMLSRHQRNADELDPSTNINNANENPLNQLPTVVENISSRLRMRQTVNSTTVTRNGIEIPERQVRQASLRNNTRNISNRLIDEESDDDQNEERMQQDNDNSSEESDTDDNAPLTSFVRHLNSSSTAAAATSSSTTSPAIRNQTNNDRIRQQRTLRRRNFTSDEDYEGDGDFDDYIEYRRISRSTRNLKRPHYNEDSDDENADIESSMFRKRHTTATATITTTNNNSHNIRLSSLPNYRQRMNNVPSTSTTTASSNRNLIDDDYMVDSENEHNAEQTISISSRGRIRKITAKARGLFRD